MVSGAISGITTALGELGGEAWGLECREHFREVFLKKLTLELNLSEGCG